MSQNFNIENSSGKPLILDRVFKHYGTTAPIIENLSHTFAAGSATGLVGPNGSGKSTLLRLLTCASYPSSGSVTHGELNIHDHPYAYLKDVGIVHDRIELPEYLTATEILEYILRSRGQWNDSGEERIATALDDLLLDDRRNNLIGTYSSGMLIKTQIAMALITHPAVLLMDEPLRGLDTSTLSATLRILHEYKTAGGLLILSSHLQDALEEVCDQFIELRHGVQPSK